MGYLVLTLRHGGYATVGDDIEVKLVDSNNSQARIAIKAPPEIAILRDDAKKRTPPKARKERNGENK